jgi:hypothetical protein
VGAALAVVCEIVAGLTVPDFAALHDVTTTDAYHVAVASSGVRWSYWAVLVLAIIATAAALLTRLRSGRADEPRVGLI